MQLNQLADNKGATQNRKRVGRGLGSGLGKTCGVGQKGQKSRTGVAINGFEGGQMPIHRRMPKRGFNNTKFQQETQIINLGDIEGALKDKRLDAKGELTPEILADAGLIRTALQPLRLLGNGALSQKINITVAYASKSAQAAVEKAGGKITLS